MNIQGRYDSRGRYNYYDIGNSAGERRIRPCEHGNVPQVCERCALRRGRTTGERGGDRGSGSGSGNGNGNSTRTPRTSSDNYNSRRDRPTSRSRHRSPPPGLGQDRSSSHKSYPWSMFSTHSARSSRYDRDGHCDCDFDHYSSPAYRGASSSDYNYDYGGGGRRGSKSKSQRADKEDINGMARGAAQARRLWREFGS